jgi:hypothetical protein
MVDQEKKARAWKAPMIFLLFVICLATAAWFIVLNPNKIAENLPEKGQPTISPR